MTNGKYSLSSIAKLTKSNLSIIINFIISQRFNYCIHCYDSTYTIPQFVYFIIFSDYIKIGRTFDLSQRYSPSELKDNVKRIVFVNNVVDCEKEIKDKFKKKYKYFNDGSIERFKINHSEINSALLKFDKIVRKYSVKNIENKHIKYYNEDKYYGTGYFVSPLACSMLISMFCKIDYSICVNFINAVENIYRHIDKNDFIATFTINKQNYQYWKYYGYIIIVNLDTEEVNISRLWNSIMNTDKEKITKKPQLNKFLKTRQPQLLLQNHNIKLNEFHYNKKPLLNGKWGPLIFVHLILFYLNSKYMLEISQMLTNMIFQRRIDIRNDNGMTGGNKKQNMIIDMIAKKIC